MSVVSSDAASDVLSRMDAAIASMKESRKEFATLLAKSAKSAATKEKRAVKAAEKKELEAKGEKPAPKAKTSAWQAFSGGDEVHGVEPAYLKYADQYAAYVATLTTRQGATIKFAKVAREEDYAKADYAALEERFAALSAAKSVSSGGSKKTKLTEEEKLANREARKAATVKRNEEKKAALKAEKEAAKAAPVASASDKKVTVSVPPADEAKPKPKPKAKKAPSDDEADAEPTPKKPKAKAKKVVAESESESDAEPTPKKPKAKAAAAPVAPKKAPKPEPEEEGEDTSPYVLEEDGSKRTVLRTPDNYLFESDDGEPGDYIGLLNPKTGVIDKKAANPFTVV